MVLKFSAGVTRNWAPASMQARAVSGSRTVPAPSVILSPNSLATFSSACSAPGTVIVISAARMPPRYRASIARIALSALLVRTTGTTPISMIEPSMFCRCISDSVLSKIMHLVTFRRSGAPPEAGVLVDSKVTGLGTDMLSLIASERVPEASGPSYDLASITLMAPVPRPPKLICVGLNYRDHVIESKMEIPKVPTIFNKFPNVVIGPGEPIVLPKASERPDYEAEFAFVIGRGGRHIPANRAMEHVFGYTIVNDVSARDFQMATSQWLMGKTFDTFAPMGPWLVTADEIADPHALDISLDISNNGSTERLQQSNTRELIFKIPALIEYLSTVVTLEPGDVVSTGTPAGVGFARKPPRYLASGDEVIVRVAGLGELRNPCIAET